LDGRIPAFMVGSASMCLGGVAAMPFIRRELRILLRL
jgi:hypothetical protein